MLERESELAAIGAALERVRDAGSGGTLLIDGPPGIGKTSLIVQLGRRAAAGGYTVLRARGSEIERDFGFGIVRQLFGPLLRPLDVEARARLFAGPASLAAAIFGMAEVAAIDVPTAEASLYGLFWLLAGLAEEGPIAVAVDDAHWSDTASLRFFQYMGRRLDGIPLLIALAARPNEPGAAGRDVAGDRRRAGGDDDLPAPAERSGHRRDPPRPARSRRLGAGRGRLSTRRPAATRC